MTNQSATELRIAVLAGGDSAERDISLDSGSHVVQALRAAGHLPRLIDPRGRVLADIDWRRYDLCFIALHGGAGEDGRVQLELDRLGVPYTGSDAAACRLAMSKSASKERWQQADVPTAASLVVHAGDPLELVASRVARLGYPVVVKPDNQGSSLGVSILRDHQTLAIALAVSARFGSFTLIEKFIAGRELTVGFVDDEALPAIEVVSGRQLFDFAAKYKLDSTTYHFATRGDDAVFLAAQSAARAAQQALETRGACRVDVIVDGNGSPWVLELNAVPGFTSHSLLPMAASRAGMSMPELCDRRGGAALAAEVVP